MLKLLEFDYSIEYKQGKENSIADALSRKEDLALHDQLVAILAVIPKWIEDVLETCKDDTLCHALL
jgi:hypothetical protein